jgi:hypothetical protein
MRYGCRWPDAASHPGNLNGRSRDIAAIGGVDLTGRKGSDCDRAGESAKEEELR